MSASPSGSVAVTVATATVFSANDRFALAPPPLLVMAGAPLLTSNVNVRGTGSRSTPPSALPPSSRTWKPSVA